MACLVDYSAEMPDMHPEILAYQSLILMTYEVSTVEA